MKKFEQLGRKLSMTEQKKIMGGYNNQGSHCTRNEDCGTADFDCNGVTVTVQGKCSHQFCVWEFPACRS